MNQREMEEYKRFTRSLTRESERIIKQFFRKPVDIQLKDDSSPVTAVDRMVESVMRDLITTHYPDHGIIGEEFGNHNPDSEYQWVLDPIDGTKSFICGAVTFGTLIGLMYKNKPVIGALNLPALGEYLIGDNTSALLNGVPCRLRKCTQINKAVLLATDDQKYFYEESKAFRHLLSAVSMYRFYGDCYGYYLLVSGFADIMYDPKMSPWDIIPLIPIINGAGGVISGHGGHDAVSAQNAIACSKVIHDDVLNILANSASKIKTA
jgi:myo-inositol-1(or 4)-monophosphatase